MAKPRLLQFLKAASGIGVGSIIFSVIFLTIAWWEHYQQKNVPASWFVAGAVICFGYGCYLAWLHAQEESERLALIVADQEPNLKLTIFNCLNRYDSDNDAQAFILAVEINNSGATTAITGWSAEYIVGESRERMTTHRIPNGFSFMLKTGIPSAPQETKLFLEKEMLPFILANRSVDRNAFIQGRLFMMVPGNRSAQTNACQYSIRVECVDSRGKHSSAVYTPHANFSKSIDYLPTEVPPTRQLASDSEVGN